MSEEDEIEKLAKRLTLWDLFDDEEEPYEEPEKLRGSRVEDAERELPFRPQPLGVGGWPEGYLVVRGEEEVAETFDFHLKSGREPERWPEAARAWLLARDGDVEGALEFEAQHDDWIADYNSFVLDESNRVARFDDLEAKFEAEERPFARDLLRSASLALGVPVRVGDELPHRWPSEWPKPSWNMELGAIQALFGGEAFARGRIYLMAEACFRFANDHSRVASPGVHAWSLLRKVEIEWARHRPSGRPGIHRSEDPASLSDPEDLDDILDEFPEISDCLWFEGAARMTKILDWLPEESFPKIRARAEELRRKFSD